MKAKAAKKQAPKKTIVKTTVGKSEEQRKHEARMQILRKREARARMQISQKQYLTKLYQMRHAAFEAIELHSLRELEESEKCVAEVLVFSEQARDAYKAMTEAREEFERTSIWLAS